VSGARDASSAPRPAPASLAAPPSFAAGDTWTYRLVNQLDQSERRVVLRIKEIRGDEVHFANGNIGDLLGNFTRIKRSEERTDEFSPSTYMYVFPLKAGGA
jgi:hypothetical protein